jgi:hypothetical protein
VAVYARSDVMGIAVPVSDGGCGSSHSRPVVQGAPAKVWKLTCGPCETVIKRDIRASTVEWTDKDRVKHEYNTSTWADDPTRIPLTPDEERVSRVMEREGKGAMASAFEGMAQALIKKQREEAAADTEAAVLVEERSHAQDEINELKAQIALLVAKVNGEPGIPKPVITGEPDGIIVNVCPDCGGPLRKPGSRGPSPKVCADCKPARRKVKASA